MKKIIITICTITFLILGCTKSNVNENIDFNNQPILLKVDAEHNDGIIVSSPIVLIR